MTQTIALIDYGAGNVRSAANALEEAARREGLSVTVDLTNDPEAIIAADRVLLPGVGAFGACRAGIDAVDGLYEALEDVALKQAKPFLGICVGMQLLATRGLEHGEHEGFGWIPGEVRRLAPRDQNLKIPHMGWNAVSPVNGAAHHPVFGALAPGEHAYFVHSYAFDVQSRDNVALVCEYGGEFTAALARGNVIGTQFHPEKSQAAGLALLGAFLKWTP